MDPARKHWKWLVLPLVASLAIFAAACGDDDDDDADGDTTPAATRAAGTTPDAGATTDDGGEATGDEAEIEAAVQAVFDAWNAQDVEGLIAGFTDAGLVSSFGEEGQVAEEVASFLPEFIGSDPISGAEFANTTVDGESATTEVQFAVGGAYDAATFSLVNEAGAWKIDGEEDLLVEAPAGTTLVHVDLNEFAFAFNPDDVTGTNIAFEASNVGAQQHELALVRIPADAVVDDILQAFLEGGPDSPPPASVEFLGAAAPIEPDATQNLVFVDPLTAGRYLMVCFFPDTDEGPEGTPHALKGMVRDFTIE